MAFDPIKAKALLAAALEVPAETKEKKERPIIISTRTKRTNVTGMNKEVSEVETKSDFKEVRHLVEYLLTKHTKIRYEQTSVVVKKHFPEKNYDAGQFTWWKLEMLQKGRAEFQDLIDLQIKPEETKEAQV